MDLAIIQTLIRVGGQARLTRVFQRNVGFVGVHGSSST